jgi:chromosome segregation ATPase
MKILDEKINSLTKKLNSKMKKFDKLNTRIETANRLIHNYNVELQLKENLCKRVGYIKDDIIDLKDQFVNDSENYFLDHIEEFAETVLEKIKDLNRTNREIAKRMNLSVDDIKGKIEAVVTLNNKRLKEIDALKLEITNLEDQIDDLNAKSRAELDEGYVPEDKWWTVSHVKQNVEDSEEVEA